MFFVVYTNGVCVFIYACIVKCFWCVRVCECRCTICRCITCGRTLYWARCCSCSRLCCCYCGDSL